MAPSTSVHRSNKLGSNRSASIIIPSDDSDSAADFDQPQEKAIVTGSDPSRGTAAKRKAPDQSSLTPHGKRTRVSHPTRDVLGEAALQKWPYNPRFWYPDGNVVIKAGNTYFKLLRSRLAQQCRYFQELFSPPAQNQIQPSSSMDASHLRRGDLAPLEELDGCAVYEIPGINVSDFTTFLKFLEYPLEHSVSTAPSDKLYALLRASDILGCDLVCRLAKEAVAKQWPSLQPPMRGVKYWCTPDLPRANDAIQAIVHARRYHISFVLKSAFYELLRNTAFWDAVRNTHTSSGVAYAEREASSALLAPLSHGDLVHLQQARWELREAWEKLVRTPPGSDAGWKMRTCTICPPAQNGQPRPNREDAWDVEIRHAGHYVKFKDPIAGTYLMEGWLDELKHHSRGKWCRVCLEERECAWTNVRATWWQQLDGWLHTSLKV